MSGREGPHELREGQNDQELLRQCILFGILFRVAMADLERVRHVPLRLSYDSLFQGFFEELSRWAERRHHQLRRLLRRRGCSVISSRRERHMYVVRYRQRGYLREALYSVEILRAECQELVRLWSQGRADNGGSRRPL